jgi:hypothetical protein
MDLEADYNKVRCFELEREMEIRIAGWNDLLTCMQSLKLKIEESEGLHVELKALTEAAELVENLFEPRVVGVQPRPLVERLKDTPKKILEYAQRLACMIPNQVLSFIKSFYGEADLTVIMNGRSGDCTGDRLNELMQQTSPIAEAVSFIELR